jgi:flagellar M-ring protein FliF
VKPDQLLEHLRHLFATLTPVQLATLAVSFIGVVAVVAGSAYYVNQPSYSLLFSDLDAESAAAVVTRLKNDKVPYLIDAGGRSVRVASERADELRLDFAGQGQPMSGRIGFEIFDRTAFGTTEFLEHVNYRRALEGELARTISTIAEVASARVHIAMAKDSLFSSEQQPAKASVVLKLRSNRLPAPAMVAGIAGLVSASVESLRPESVIIVDTNGRSLAHGQGPGDDSPGGMPMEKQQQFEREMATKVLALLEPVIGSGHVRVNVSARLKSDSEETTEERWDPANVLRSRQSTADVGATPTAQGPAGARANAPPTVSTAPTTPPAPAATVGSSRTSETTNFEISKTTVHTIAPRGQIARLSVAVVLDDDHVSAKDAAGAVTTTNKPRTAEELQRIQGLVSAAVGLDTDRGDQVTIENIAFGDQGLDEPSLPPLGWWPQIVEMTSSHAFDLIRISVVLIIGVLAVLALLKPMARWALHLPSAATLPPVAVLATAPGEPPRTVADLEADIEAEIDAGAVGTTSDATRRLPALTRRLITVADKEPERLARLIRSMMAESDGS